MVQTREPLIFTPLHRIEVRNALRKAAGRAEISESECRAGFRLIEDDLREGLFLHTAANWTNVFRRADDLSETYAGRQGQRTVDLLHVALALEGVAAIFLTFDQRQRRLALAAGLRVKP